MKPSPPPEQGKIAGIDFGTVRIGVAMCDAERLVAFPFEIWRRKTEQLDLRHFQEFVKNERIVHFVVGLPLHCSGEMSDKARQATEFAEKLADATGCSIDFLDERFVGDLRIVFPEDTSLNKTITVVQKYSGDYDDNANDVSQSNKAYAMGYGYDMISSTEGYLDPSAIKSEVFDTKTLFEDGTFAYGPNTQTLDETTVTGSTISDISFKLGVKTKIEGGTALFSGEMKSSFDMSKTSYNNYEFALNYIDVTTQTITSEVPLEILADSLSMIVSAYYAINGLGRTGQKFPSTNAGFRRLIKGYGTHVVMGAKVGGRIRQSMTVDVSKVTSSYDLEAFAKAAYKGLVVKAEGSVEAKMKQSCE